eukprot:RCo005745
MMASGPPVSRVGLVRLVFLLAVAFLVVWLWARLPVRSHHTPVSAPRHIPFSPLPIVPVPPSSTERSSPLHPPPTAFPSPPPTAPLLRDGVLSTSLASPATSTVAGRAAPGEAAVRFAVAQLSAHHGHNL